MKKIIAAMLFIAIAGCSDGPVLDVIGMKNDITRYSKATVTMEGVVSGWQSKDKSQFGIADIKESGQKIQFVVPVRYAGKMPEPGTKVRVTGIANIKAHEFQATKVTLVK